MSDIVLEIKDLTKYYGSHLALDHVNLQVPRGSIYGLLGRNGSGKTTAIKLVLGLLRPTAGSAQILGCDSQEITPAVRQRIGYAAEGHRLPGWMQIRELEKFQRPFYPDQWDGKLFHEMLDYFELSPKHKVKQMSNGQRGQISLALTMASSPELLIMDDPTLGLDTAIRRQFLEGMIRLIQREEKTILFSSHILSDVERVVDRIAVLDKGIVRADCPLEEFRGAIRKFRFRFKNAIPADIHLAGLLHRRQKGRDLELTLVGTRTEQIDAWAAEADIEYYKELNMNLEDQFIEYTEPPNSTRLFLWENEHDEVYRTA